MPSLAPVAAVAASEPDRWPVLGYHVQAGPLCAALIACACVRFWSAGRAKDHRWSVDVPVSLLTALFTATAVISIEPNLITGCVIGTGLGALGEGIISKAKGWADRWLGGETGDKPVN